MIATPDDVRKLLELADEIGYEVVEHKIENVGEKKPIKTSLLTFAGQFYSELRLQELLDEAKGITHDELEDDEKA